jgi:hypothetical protein
MVFRRLISVEEEFSWFGLLHWIKMKGHLSGSVLNSAQARG